MFREKAIAGVKWTARSAVIVNSLQVAQLAVLSRLLTPKDFGLMAMIMVIIGFAQAYTDVGVSKAIIYHQDITKYQLSSLYWLNIMGGVFVFILILVIKPIIIILYRDPRLEELIFFTALIFLIVPIGQQFEVLMQKELLFDQLAYIEIVSTVAGVLIAVTAALNNQGVFSLVWGLLTNAAVKTLIIGSIGLKKWKPDIHFRFHEIREILRFGMFQTGEVSINYLGRNLDKLLIGALLGAQALGYYNVAYQLMVKPYKVFNPIITKVAFPLFSKIQEETEKLRAGFLEVLQIVALFMVPVYTGMIVLSDLFVTVLLGQEWLSAIAVLQILSILGIFYSLGNPLGSLLLSKGRADIGFYLNVLMVILYSVAIWFGARFGLQGIALGLVISTSIILFPLGFWIRWILVRMRPLEYVRSLAPMLSSALMMGGILIYFKDNVGFIQNPLMKLIILSSSGAMFYILFIFLMHKEYVYRIWKEIKQS
jgi:lipopolysaccharide exporter